MSGDKSGLFIAALGLDHIDLSLRFVPEYRFARAAIGDDPTGKAGPKLRQRLAAAGLCDWRFDWACPSHMVAVEVDGNAWRVKGGGRHGQDSDRDKMNMAAALGWRVLRFSPKQLEKNPARCAEITRRAMEAE